MARERQLVLDLPHRTAYGRDDFLLAPCNRDAVDWIDRWPDWNLSGLVISGPPGSGKSHLGAVWREKSGAELMGATNAADTLERILDDDTVRHCFADDGDRIDPEALFHLFNCLRERDGSLVLAAERPPGGWKNSLPDLVSRLKTLPVAEIAMPDDAIIEAVLVKLFADRQLDVPPEVIAYLLPRMERSFAAARTLVMKIDSEALARRRAVTVPLVRAVLEQEETP